MNGGWSVPIGVHKIICRSPGLTVTVDVHRRSPPVRRGAGRVTNGDTPDFCTDEGNFKGKDEAEAMILSPNKFVEVLEIQQHGGRVRGRVIWEEVYDRNKNTSKEQYRSSSRKFDRVHSIEKTNNDPGGGSTKVRTGRRISVGNLLPGRKARDKSPTNSTVSSNHASKRKTDKIFIQYQGWISLQWDDKAGRLSSSDGMVHKRGIPYADEDEGPWTEPVTPGVYRINFNGGLPLRKTSDRDSQVLDVLERGRFFEVLETIIKEDRVRARCLVPPPPGERNDGKNKGTRNGGYQNGYISLANALSGSTGVSPVPLGAYVAVADCGCPVTEGGRLDSKLREVLERGTCFEVTATRMEDGVVRGLVAWGGFVSLFVPGSGITGSRPNSRSRNNGRPSTKHGNTRADKRLNFALSVPLGSYQVIYPHGLPATAGFSRHTPIKTKLKLDDIVEIVETRVEEGTVRGRLSAIICTGGISRGWISIFDPSCRWAKFAARDEMLGSSMTKPGTLAEQSRRRHGCKNVHT